MTNAQLQNIYITASVVSHEVGLRAVWNAGWHAKAGTTPNAGSPDESLRATAPTAVVTIKKGK